MSLLDNKPHKVDGLIDFSWSPTNNAIAYWVPEADPKPARVTILSIPQRTEIAVKNLFNVASVRISGQDFP
jgi:translation initiation factor 3 subunit B